METKEELQGNSTIKRKSLLILNCLILSIGNCGGPLIMRLYFIHGGKRIWLSAWLQTSGWPVILIPLAITYLHRRATDPATKLFYMKTPMFMAAAIVGVLTGLDDYLYAYGVARLPVSTSSLIIATQLAFTATSDKPAGESSREYMMGFVMTLGAAALYGFILPLVELTYKKSRQEISYTLVMEIQMIMCLLATVFCTVGMLINKDFQAIPREARDFELGDAKYYHVVVWSAVIWQCFFLGAIGVIFCASSLLSGILIALLLPATEILAVVFFQEKFQAEKGVALSLSLWGFASYFYGEMKENKKKKLAAPQTLMPPSNNPVGNA
ncbi:hypothetical protein OIU79_002560 [Salix purpurea]|uniref:Probable purine permease n=1 Tax=Salix purpurea TaxID=77065 RepID=A0A9Q0ZIB4_SALPP|nr:hypothetical protein OIU79_002560 [Salix purpurea]